MKYPFEMFSFLDTLSAATKMTDIAFGRAAGMDLGLAHGAALDHALVKDAAIDLGLAHEAARDHALVKDAAIDLGLAHGAAIDLGLAHGAAMDHALVKGAAMDFALSKGTAIDLGLAHGAAMDHALVKGAAMDFALVKGAAMDFALSKSTAMDLGLAHGAAIDHAFVKGAAMDFALADSAAMDLGFVKSAAMDFALAQGAAMDLGFVKGAAMDFALAKGTAMDLGLAHGAAMCLGLVKGTAMNLGLGMLDFDVRSLLDPASSSYDIVRDVDRMLGTIKSWARDVPTSRERHDEHDENGNRDESRAEHAKQNDGSQYGSGRLWVPRQGSLLRAPGNAGRREQQQILEPVHVFCGNARIDEQHRDKLINHLCMLRRRKIIRTWHEGEVLPGDDLREHVWRNLDLAKIILLLISAEYINELYERDMMHRIEERDREGSAVVIPILVRPVDMREDDGLVARLSPLPSNRSAITAWPDPDAAWADVASGVRSVVESIRRASRQLYH